MSPRILMTADGETLDPTVPLLHADDLGAVRGDGIFETLLVREGRAVAIGLHLDRLTASAAAVGLPEPDRDRLFDVLGQAARAWAQAHEDQGPSDWPADPDNPHDDANFSSPDGLLRLVITRGRESTPDGPETSYISVGALGERAYRARREGVSAISLERGYSIHVAARAPWQLQGAKTLSYATNMAALRYATAHGADDVIYLSSEGNVLEGPRSTVVLWSDGTLITPPPEEGILRGTMAQALLAQARKQGIATAVSRVRPVDLIAADGVWLVSSVTLAARVHTLDSFPLSGGDLHDKFAALVQDALVVPVA